MISFPPLKESHKRKIISAFFGLVRTSKLEPYDSKKANTPGDYLATFNFYDTEEGSRQLYLLKREIAGLLDLFEKIFSGRIDRKLAGQLLSDSIDKFIVSGPSVSHHEIRAIAEELIEEVRNEIRQFSVYVPVFGIDLTGIDSIQVGNCLLSANVPKSEFSKTVASAEEKSGLRDESKDLFKSVKATFKVYEFAHLNRSYVNAKAEAEVSCHILMLFMGSFYYDVLPNPARPRVLSIGAPLIQSKDDVFIASTFNDGGELSAAWRQEFPGQQSFTLDKSRFERIKNSGLEKLNELVRDSGSARGDDVERRIRLAVTWFGKAATAETVAESLLSNAVALEALLSSGRNRQEKTAEEVAYLVVYKDNDRFPIDGPLSKVFGEKLETALTYTEKLSAVEKRVLELLRYRNRIVHGHIPFEQCDPIWQLDFETFVRNTILSFIKGGWTSLSSFKVSVKRDKARAWLKRVFSFRST